MGLSDKLLVYTELSSCFPADSVLGRRVDMERENPMLWRYQPLDLEAVLSSEIHASGPFRGFRVNGSRKYCIRSSTMATHVLDQIPIINSRTNGDSAAFLVSTAAVRAEEKQQRRQVDVILMKSKSYSSVGNDC
ncbi:toxoplasma gondii family B protein [Toxoplasma gondii p89]|uniref:Toxoplasma gondii family B protein n=1 Tax=Toxoplasma gondii p89 TaxID=943119 RepID=A0A086J6N3_TOXGO|nr:toxoplasma gondii family B protein [Toxoplasma gondii p89]